jgi:hypothetical protein
MERRDHMRTVQIFHAVPWDHFPRQIEAVRFDEEMPTFSGADGWEERARELYEEQGELLAAVLLHVLPGGTVDQLLVALLKHKASPATRPRWSSLFKIPFGRNDKETGS